MQSFADIIFGTKIGWDLVVTFYTKISLEFLI